MRFNGSEGNNKSLSALVTESQHMLSFLHTRISLPFSSALIKRIAIIKLFLRPRSLHFSALRHPRRPTRNIFSFDEQSDRNMKPYLLNCKSSYCFHDDNLMSTNRYVKLELITAICEQVRYSALEFCYSVGVQIEILKLTKSLHFSPRPTRPSVRMVECKQTSKATQPLGIFFGPAVKII